MRILLDESVLEKPVAILVVRAKTNRLDDLAQAVPLILSALAEMSPRTLRRVPT